MKYFLLLMMLGMFCACHAQSTFAIKANMNNGIGVQQGKLPNVYGIGGMIETSIKKVKRLKVTGGLDIGINGIKKMPFELKFNGSVTNTTVHYTSYVMQLSSGLKYILREDKKWTPYAAISAGALGYYTEMSVEDPDDPDGCSPLETKPVSSSIILTGTSEIGIRIRMKKNCNGSRSFFEAGAGYLAGTRGKYIRLEKNTAHNHDDNDYMIKFQHNTTGEIHEHSVGTKYKTMASQLIIHVGFVHPL